MAELWERPESYPATPPFDPVEGWPVPPGPDIEPVFADGGGAVRETRQVAGVNFLDPATAEQYADFRAVEGGRFNDMRRVYYDLVRRLARLEFLVIGPVGWSEGWLYAGEDCTNFANVFDFWATGSGTSIEIMWGGTEHDPRSLPDIANPIDPDLSDEVARWALQPGLLCSDSRSGYFGVSQITDVQFTGTVGWPPQHTATLTLNRPLNCGRFTRIWIAREHRLGAWPVMQQSLTAEEDTASPRPCVHAIKAAWGGLESFATIYPSLPMAAGISGRWFCSQMNEAGVRLDLFAPRCNATACPRYRQFGAGVPTARTWDCLFLAAGKNLHHSVPGSADPRDILVGMDGWGWSGLWQLAGLPVAHLATSLSMPRRDYFGFAAMKRRISTETNDQGWTPFRSWYEHQTESGETDATWPLDVDQIGKRDACGGTGPGARDLVDDSARTPGYQVERAVGVRNIAHVGLGGDEKSIIGWGDDMVQRVRPRRYTSPPFTPPLLAGTLSNQETRLTSYPEPIPFSSADTFPFNLTWELPRFCEETARPKERKIKILYGTIAAAEITGDVLSVEFELGADTAYYPLVGVGEYGTQTFDCGGNVVASDLCRMSRNPASSRRVGGRQHLLYPGDAVSFAHADLDGVFLTCIAAEAFGGEAMEGATFPNEGVVEIPEFLRTSCNLRDVAHFALDSRNGERVREFHATTGLVGLQLGVAYEGPLGPAVAPYVSHGSIAPPTVLYGGGASGYAPVIYRVPFDAVNAADVLARRVVLAEADYRWSPDAGIAYFDSSAWHAMGRQVLVWEGWVFDARRNFPCENVEAVERFAEHVCEHGFCSQPFSVAVTGIAHGSAYEPGGWRSGVGLAPRFYYDPRESGSVAEPADLVLSIAEAEEGWREDAREGVFRTMGLQVLTSGGFVPLGSYSNEILVFNPGAPAPAWTAGEIAEAYLDIEVRDVTIHNWITYYERWGTNANVQTEEEPDTFPLTVGSVVFSVGPGGVVEIEEFVANATGSLTRVVDGDTVCYRGTLDATASLRAMAAAPMPEGKHFGFILFGPNGIGTEAGAATAAEAAMSWLTRWDVVIVDDEIDTVEAESKWIEYKSFTVGRLWVRPDWAGIGAAAPQLHFDEYGQADAPDLLKGTG